MKKRLLAMMMAIVMVMTLLPTSALAVGGDANAPKTSVSVAPDSPVQITKAVSAENGAYKLTLDAYATGTVSTTDPTPSDIVLVLDVSGSMADTLSNTDQTKLDALKSAVNTFIDRTADQNAKITDTAKKNKISIVKFAGKMSNKIGNDTYDTGIWPLTNKNNYSQIVKGLTPVDQNGQNDLKAEVNKLTAAGATSADYGMDLAQTALQDSAADRHKVVVFFTDGEPNHDNGFNVKVAAAAINSAKTLKTDGAKIYTIGVMKGADPNDTNSNINKYMNAVSSNYPNASATVTEYVFRPDEINITLGDSAEGSYYKAASDASELTHIFDEISTEITSGVEADDTSVLTDTISEYFVPSGITAAADGKVSGGVKVFKVEASGTDAAPEWGTPVDITGQVAVTLKGKTIEVTGFDYSDKGNLVVNKNGNWQGYKLQLEFNIAADTACTTWQSGTHYYPTNVAGANNAENAGLAYGENGKTELTESPAVAVTAYSVTYNGNGSTGGNAVTDAKAYIPGATVTVQKNTFTKTGYRFTAWNTQANGEGTPYTDTFTMANENVTLYAQWAKDENATKKASYSVEYYKDGKKDDTQTVQQDIWVGSNTLTVNKADINTKDKYAGYVFEKTEPASIPETIEDNGVIKVYYAKDENGNGTPDYKETKYTITYVAGTTDTVTGLPKAVPGVLAGTEQTVSSEKPTREGYTFSGWQAPEGVTVTDNKFTMPAKNVTFTAQWTANDVTITFNANGGEWAENANVDDYTLIDNNTKASKTYQPSEAVAKIATDPVWNGHTFNGWYVRIPGKTGEEPEKYFITVWNAALQAQRIQEYGGVIYADWTGAAPAGQCTYTTRQHYIDEKGNEVATVDVGGADLLALQGTKISDLIKHLETDQNYFGQKYLYDGTKTTVNDAAYKAETMTLNTNGTAIDLYYYLDEWNDENDKVTGGDGTPDKYQALVKFESADATKGTVTGEGAVQVFTFKDNATKGDVTPALTNVELQPKDGFVFDYWTKDNGTEPVDLATTIKDVPGGTTITFKANWKSNVVTITFDANGGAWAADVAGYTMNADKTTASKKFNLSDTVEKITPDPVQDGKKFSGWGVKLDENGKPSDKIVAYPLLETSATAAAHKRIFDEKPIIFYAMWEDAAQPTEKLNYTIHQHYIGSNGKQDAQFNDELPKTASAGTKISDLIPAELQENRKYYYQTYIYLSSETKIVNDNVATPVADDTVLNKDNTQIHLYYYLDAWNDENNTLTGGDNIPDKYQAVVTYKVVGGTWKDKTTDDQVQVFTLKTKNEETGVWEDVTPAPVLGDTIPTGMISSYSRTASQSWDKDITKDTKVTESVTYTYTFTKGSSGGGGGSSSTHYYISLKKVDAQDGEALSGAKFGLYLDGKQIATATSDRNGIVRFSMGSSNYRSLTDKSNLYCQELTAPEGYKLSNEKIAVSKKDVSTSSSMSDKNAKTVKNSRSKTPSMLNGKDHFAYIVGYPDKTVHPQSSITRAEVATIFFRLLTEETRTANATKTNNYADVSSDKWYNQAVSTLSAMGIIKGDSRGNFNPNAPITRAEFAAIAARFDKTEDVAVASFGDVATHWAKPEISVAANNGWINGYTDGTFHPDSRITRAEAMAMINRVLQRLPESKADLLDGMIQWSDNADTSKWYYLAVQEATNSHYYELKANQHEKWTKLRENRDWTELEK